MIDGFSNPEFFPNKLRLMEKARPQNFLLTGMSDLAGWKPERRDQVFAKMAENPHTEQAHALHIPVFWKEDLVPIMGEEGMVQELPEAYNKVLEAQEAWQK